ncbi:unnamed protein product [Clavelina lepadiformis]|uniref:Uncharacterized protein n=1 Tax=Clavelina lepadiformis TaxID=159417 RepID=A0ABP0FCI7_CLALP
MLYAYGEGGTSVSSVTTISTDPTDTTLATSFNNLIVTVQFPTPTAFGDSCVWLYEGELDSGSGVSFYSQLSGCGPPAPGTYDTITCTEQTIDGSAHVETVLTITQPLVAGNLNIEVTCTTATTPGPITRTVQGCSLDETTYSSLAFTCNDAPCEYNSVGTLSCKEGFSSSGESTSSTTCQADATLTNLDVLTCAAITTSTITSTADTTLQGNWMMHVAMAVIFTYVRLLFS